MTAQLHMVTVQTVDGTADRQELDAAGIYAAEENGWRLTYPEGDGVTVTLHCTPGEVTVERRGAARSRLVFRPGERYEGIYGTPYGDFDVTVITHALACTLTDKGGQVTLHYTLTMGGGEMDMQLQINVSI